MTQQALYRPDGSIGRYCWELALMTEIRGALRRGDLWVKGSDRYQNPARFLLPDDRWDRDREDHGIETGIGTDARQRLEHLNTILNQQLEATNEALADETVLRIEDELLVVTPLEADDTPETVEALKSESSQSPSGVPLS